MFLDKKIIIKTFKIKLERIASEFSINPFIPKI